MSVYKEGYFTVQYIQQRSRQIYPDAADYGMPVRSGSPDWNAIKGIVDMYGNPERKRVHRYATGVTAEAVIELMDEWVTGRRENFKITYTSARGLKGYDGYVTVEEVR